MHVGHVTNTFQCAGIGGELLVPDLGNGLMSPMI